VGLLVLDEIHVEGFWARRGVGLLIRPAGGCAECKRVGREDGDEIASLEGGKVFTGFILGREENEGSGLTCGVYACFMEALGKFKRVIGEG
jgi:hypothetical protein